MVLRRIPLAATVLIAALPVGADAGTLAVIGSSGAAVHAVTGGWQICAGGDIEPTTRVSGEWTLQIGGVRDGIPFTLPTWTSPDWSVFHCESVYRNGATTGSISVDFGYLGAGAYVFAHSIAGAAWGPVVGNQSYGVDPTP